MSLACARAARLSLASAGGHASEAERLELEAHLAGCARCAAEHGALVAVRAGLAAEPAGLGATARERVRRAALAAPAGAQVPARRLLWPVAAGAALAVAASVALWVGSHPGGSSTGVAEITGVEGDVIVAPATAGTAGAGAAGGGGPAVTLRSRGGGRARIDDAQAELGRATEIAWRRERRSVELREGSVTIDVEHRPGQRFEVRTPRFVVEVVGTRFSVDMAGVRTARGKVRVLSLDGTLIAYVEAGESWTAPIASPAPVPALAPPAPAPPAPPAPVSLTPAASPAAPPTPGLSADVAAGARLARARRALARGDAAEARRAVEPVFRASREVAAEARAIHAESYLVEGRHADAIEGYEIVVHDFPGTPQAESALYAVAQLESEHGSRAAARATLRRYLDRYPRGRFAKEAAERLAGLDAPAR
jgi:hypothetical protein